MNKEELNQLHRRWYFFHDNVEETMVHIMSLGEGILFIPFLPI